MKRNLSLASPTGWLMAYGGMLFAGAVLIATLASCSPATSPTPQAARSGAPRLTLTGSSGAEAAIDAEAPGNEGELPIPRAISREDRGRELYGRHCAACHGAEGDGQGIAANFLFPKPRNFWVGQFRLISTTNNVPSRDDLHAVLLRGMPGSSMPPWAHLSQEDREALVDEVLRLRKYGAGQFYAATLVEQEELTDEEIQSEEVQEEIEDYVKRFTTPGEPSPVPELGERTEEGIADARQTYAKQGCLQCHGEQGKGDGVEKMIDSEGFPTSPRDFTAGIFKGNDDPASIYRRIALGMPGTPMPRSSNLTETQMMNLVHFIRSMSTAEQRQAAVLNRERIVAKGVDSIAADIDDAVWSGIPRVSLRMTPLWWRNNAADTLEVQAAHDGRTLAVRMSWKDERPDSDAARTEAFEDAAAMELYRGDAEPFLGMGGPGGTVDVWLWDADRQGRPTAVDDSYPNAVVDIYPFSETAVASAELDRDGARAADQPPVSLPAVASGNQIVPPGDGSGGSSLVGGGPGSSTFRVPGNQHVQAVGHWEDGRWTVVLRRAMAMPSANEGVSLAPGCTASVAFAVWDGAARDRDGLKLITIWQDLFVEEQP